MIGILLKVVKLFSPSNNEVTRGINKLIPNNSKIETIIIKKNRKIKYVFLRGNNL